MLMFAGIHPDRTASAAPFDIRDWNSRYRRAFSWAGIACPASQLMDPATAKWARKHGIAVDVASGDELTLAASSGIRAARIVLRCSDTAGPTRRAEIMGVGKYVIGSTGQAALLRSCAQHPARVLADVTDECGDDVAGAILRSHRLDLIGLHCRLNAPASEPETYVEAVGAMIARMARIRRDRSVILTRISLAGTARVSQGSDDPPTLKRLAAAIEDGFDDACARFRFPRPGLTIAP
jgi:diaminopimelate decarboxylase